MVELLEGYVKRAEAAQGVSRLAALDRLIRAALDERCALAEQLRRGGVDVYEEMLRELNAEAYAAQAREEGAEEHD